MKGVSIWVSVSMYFLFATLLVYLVLSVAVPYLEKKRTKHLFEYSEYLMNSILEGLQYDIYAYNITKKFEIPSDVYFKINETSICFKIIRKREYFYNISDWKCDFIGNFFNCTKCVYFKQKINVTSELNKWNGIGNYCIKIKKEGGYINITLC